MAVITKYVCDRCGAECEQKPGTFALFDVAFFTGEEKDGKPKPKVVQLCRPCFDYLLSEARTPPVKPA